MANFFIRTNKSSGRATLYVRVQKPKFKISWSAISTGIEVDITKWRECYESGDAKKWNDYTREGSIGAEVKKKMDKVDEIINLLFTEGRIKSNADKHILTDMLFELANHDAILVRNEIRERKKEEEQRKLHEIIPAVSAQ